MSEVRNDWSEAQDHKVVQFILNNGFLYSKISKETVSKLSEELGIKKEAVQMRAKNIQSLMGGGFRTNNTKEKSWKVDVSSKLSKHVGSFFITYSRTV